MTDPEAEAAVRRLSAVPDWEPPSSVEPVNAPDDDDVDPDVFGGATPSVDPAPAVAPTPLAPAKGDDVDIAPRPKKRKSPRRAAPANPVQPAPRTVGLRPLGWTADGRALLLDTGTYSRVALKAANRWVAAMTLEPITDRTYFRRRSDELLRIRGPKVTAYEHNADGAGIIVIMTGALEPNPEALMGAQLGTDLVYITGPVAISAFQYAGTRKGATAPRGALASFLGLPLSALNVHSDFDINVKRK